MVASGIARTAPAARVVEQARSSHATLISATIVEDDAMTGERLERIGAVALADRHEAVVAHLLAASMVVAASAAL